jgi:hypothetical protein
MPVPMPNFAAARALASGRANIFEGLAKRAMAGAGHLNRVNQMQQAAAKPSTAMPAQPQKTFSPAPPGTGPLGPNAVQQGRMRRQQKAGVTPPVQLRQRSGKAPSFQTPGTQASGKAPSFGGAPSHRAAAPTNMTASSAAGTGKHRANPVPNANIPSMPAPRIGHIIPGAGKVNLPGPTVSAQSPFIPFAGTPTPSTPKQFGPQESSRVPMPTATANASRPAAPNNITFGSNKTSSNLQGLGHMGANLEASLHTRPLSTPAKSATSPAVDQGALFSAAPYRTTGPVVKTPGNTVQPIQFKGQGKQGNLITPGGNISKTALPPKPKE